VESPPVNQRFAPKGIRLKRTRKPAPASPVHRPARLSSKSVGEQAGNPFVCARYRARDCLPPSADRNDTQMHFLVRQDSYSVVPCHFNSTPARLKQVRQEKIPVVTRGCNSTFVQFKPVRQIPNLLVRQDSYPVVPCHFNSTPARFPPSADSQ
jgi:hypothetical protein